MKMFPVPVRSAVAPAETAVLSVSENGFTDDEFSELFNVHVPLCRVPLYFKPSKEMDLMVMGSAPVLLNLNRTEAQLCLNCSVTGECGMLQALSTTDAVMTSTCCAMSDGTEYEYTGYPFAVASEDIVKYEFP